MSSLSNNTYRLDNTTPGFNPFAFDIEQMEGSETKNLGPPPVFIKKSTEVIEKSPPEDNPSSLSANPYASVIKKGPIEKLREICREGLIEDGKRPTFKELHKLFNEIHIESASLDNRREITPLLKSLKKIYFRHHRNPLTKIFTFIFAVKEFVCVEHLNELQKWFKTPVIPFNPETKRIRAISKTSTIMQKPRASFTKINPIIKGSSGTLAIDKLRPHMREFEGLGARWFANFRDFVWIRTSILAA